MTPALEARALAKRYGHVRAVDGVDLAIAAGDSVLLIGPNGAGKSTLLRLLATLVRPTSGSVAIFGAEAVSAEQGTLRRRIGLLSHQTFLYDHLTGLENLEFYARLYGLGDPSAAALAALDRAGLAGRGDDLVRGFSRGMQQRLAIARAMLHDPEILLLDEPWSGLDRQASGLLESALREAIARGRTCVVATHDFARGLAVARRVVVLLDGRVAADEPARGLDAARLDALLGPPAGSAAARDRARPAGPA